MKEFKFELGQTVEDIITGYKGIIMGRTQYLTQCTSYGITPRKSKDLKRPDWEWFDEPRLKKTSEKIISLVNEKDKTGGPHNKSEIAPGH